MGQSVLSTGRPQLAVAGDGGTFHSGVLALMQVARDQAPVTTVILDNGSSSYTGGQPHPGSDAGPGQKMVALSEVARGFGIDQVETMEAKDAASGKLRPLLKRFVESHKPAVLIIRQR